MLHILEYGIRIFGDRKPSGRVLDSHIGWKWSAASVFSSRSCSCSERSQVSPHQALQNRERGWSEVRCSHSPPAHLLFTQVGGDQQSWPIWLPQAQSITTIQIKPVSLPVVVDSPRNTVACALLLQPSDGFSTA